MDSSQRKGSLRVTGLILAVFALVMFQIIFQPGLDDLPGIPAAGSEQQADFAAEFWPALYAGAVSSLIVGLLVGAAIFLTERRADDRRVREDYRREVAVFQERLYGILIRSSQGRWESAAASLPPNLKVAFELSQAQPLAAWRVYLPGLSGLVAALDTYQWNYERFDGYAKRVDDWLPVAIGDYLSGAGRSAEHTAMCASFVLLRSTGMMANDAAGTLGIHDAAVVDLCEQGYAALRQGPGARVMTHYARYRSELLDVSRWKLVEACGKARLAGIV